MQTMLRAVLARNPEEKCKEKELNKRSNKNSS